MLYRKLELSSVFGPPERESLHIPEAECAALVMVLSETQDPLSLSSFQDLFGLSNWTEGVVEENLDKHLVRHKWRQRRREEVRKNDALLLLLLCHISAGLISVWLLHSSKFQTSLALCFQLLSPKNNAILPTFETHQKLSWAFQQYLLGGSRYENIMTQFLSSCSY